MRTVNPSIAFDSNPKMPLQHALASNASIAYRQSLDLPKIALILPLELTALRV
jgi:hypothetical protein